MKLRLATIDDARTLFEWRNDQETRQTSHGTDEFSFESHTSWLGALLQNPMRQLFIAEENGHPVGTVRVDREPDGVSELSWTVAPEARRRGVAKQMVRIVANDILASQSIRAEVKDGNIASTKVAGAAGMKLLRQDGGVLYFFRESGT